jgi:hypothetical protein
MPMSFTITVPPEHVTLDVSHPHAEQLRDSMAPVYATDRVV